jgi:hypothetical protein
MKVLRVVVLVIGLLAILLGGWWVLQGTGIVPVGFMARHMEWAYRGVGLAVVGVTAVFISRRM